MFTSLITGIVIPIFKFFSTSLTKLRNNFPNIRGTHLLHFSRDGINNFSISFFCLTLKPILYMFWSSLSSKNSFHIPCFLTLTREVIIMFFPILGATYLYMPFSIVSYSIIKIIRDFTHHRGIFI